MADPKDIVLNKMKKVIDNFNDRLDQEGDVTLILRWDFGKATDVERMMKSKMDYL